AEAGEEGRLRGVQDAQAHIGSWVRGARHIVVTGEPDVRIVYTGQGHGQDIGLEVTRVVVEVQPAGGSHGRPQVPPGPVRTSTLVVVDLAGTPQVAGRVLHLG